MAKLLPILAAGLFLSASANAKDFSHTELAFSIDKTAVNAPLDPTYTTGDPDTYNGYTIYGSYENSSRIALDAYIRGSFSSELGTVIITIDARTGIKVPISVLPELTFVPGVGIDKNYAFLESQAPEKIINQTGYYFGAKAIYRLPFKSIELFAQGSKSTIDKAPSIGAGLSFRVSSSNKVSVEYFDEDRIERISTTFSFVF